MSKANEAEEPALPSAQLMPLQGEPPALTFGQDDNLTDQMTDLLSLEERANRFLADRFTS